MQKKRAKYKGELSKPEAGAALPGPGVDRSPEILWARRTEIVNELDYKNFHLSLSTANISWRSEREKKDHGPSSRRKDFVEQGSQKRPSSTRAQPFRQIASL